MLKTIGNRLTSLGLETLGTALLGPVGSRILGTVAERLGVPSDAVAVDDKLRAQPEEATREVLSPLEQDPEVAKASRAYWDMLSSQAGEVGQTMRAELTAGHWYQRAWRPTFGLVFTVVYGILGVAIARAIWVGNFEVVAAVAQLTVFIAAGAAVLGVYVHGRSREKLTALTGDAVPSILERIIRR